MNPVRLRRRINMSQHTPSERPAFSGTLDPSGELSCGCVLSGHSIQWCHVHAAAPELLAALDQVMSWSDDIFSERRYNQGAVKLGLEMVRDRARTAIARAKRDQ
jgi:hypothetical protein